MEDGDEVKIRRKAILWMPIAAIVAAAVLSFAAVAFGQPAMMLNAPPVNDWSTGRPVVNLALLSRAPGSLSKPYDGSVPLASYNAYGWPAVDFGSCMVLHDYPTGVYAYSFDGAGKVTFTQGATNQTPTSVTINGDSGYLEYKVTGTDPAKPFRNFKIVTPGYAADAFFTTEYLTQYDVCSVIRTMDLQKTNVVQHPVTWQGRAPPGGPQTLDAKGVSVEFLIRLANDTGKDLWICIPHSATEDTVSSMATELAAGLKPGIKVYVEESNELWNGRFPQSAATIALAKADPTLTSADPNARQYEWAVSRLRRDVLIFRSIFGADRVIGTLPGQGVIPWRIEQGLIDGVRKFGRVDDFIGFIAWADYWGPTFAVETASPTLDQLFDSAGKEVTDIGAWMADQHAALAARFNVGMAVYEGGENVADEMWSDSGQHFYGNHDLHESFQRDPRVGTLTVQSAQQAQRKGVKLYGYFCGVSNWGNKGDANRGRYGYWGVRETIADRTPKWDALVALGPTPGTPASQPPVTRPVTQPTSQPASRPTPIPANISSVTVEVPGVGVVTYTPAGAAKVTAK